VFIFENATTVIVACLAGIALCITQITMVFNQGIHLRDYWAHQKKALEISEVVIDTIDLGGRDPSIPTFCWILIVLGALYIVGFLFTLFIIK
jgi:hypothetical protein